MKKAMKLLALLLALIMVVSMFTACGKKEEAPAASEEKPAATEEKKEETKEEAKEEAPAEEEAEEIVINWFAAMYSDGTEAHLRKAFDEFEAQNPGIKVNLEIVGWDMIGERAISLIGSNQCPDIMNGNGYAGYDEDGLLYPVEEIISPELLADIQPDFYACNVNGDGVVMALPYLASVRNLYYSIDMFEEVGIEAPPKTWTEVEEVCAKIKDYYGDEVYAWGLDATINEGQTMIGYYGWNNGGGFVDEEGNWILNCEENVEGLEWIKGLYDAGYTNVNPLIETRDEMQKLFAEGKMAMLLTANFFPTLYPDLNLGIAPLPYNDARVDGPVSLGVQDGVCIFNDTYKATPDTPEKKAAMQKLLDYYYSPEVYVDYMLMEGMLPATISGAELLVERDPSKAGFVDSLSACKFYPSEKAIWGSVMDYVREAGQNVISGTMSAQEALDYAQSLCEE